MQQNESALVGHVQIAGERQRGLALHFVAKDGNGSEVAAQRELVGGEQRAGRDGEVFNASPAAEARSALEAAAIVGVQTAAMRADRLAIIVGPADLAKHRLGFLVFHLKDFGEREGLSRFGEEEVFSHHVTYRL